MSVAVLENIAPTLEVARATTTAVMELVMMAAMIQGQPYPQKTHKASCSPATLSPTLNPFARIAAAILRTISLSWRKV